ncbi:MAG: hypothetical protein LBQ24_01010 [Candidatus Peribacteria bacterium]|nr:hypothetical protein [Candidatus Peribacteria bacterium]
MDSGGTLSHKIINFFSVKKIQATFTFHKIISTSFGFNIQVTIFSIFSEI